MFQVFNYPKEKSTDLSTIVGAHGALMTYYDCIRTPIIAHALDLFEQGVIKHKTDLEFANDIVKISYGQL